MNNLDSIFVDIDDLCLNFYPHGKTPYFFRSCTFL